MIKLLVSFSLENMSKKQYFIYERVFVREKFPVKLPTLGSYSKKER